MAERSHNGRTRSEHLAWDAIILPIDHAFWQTHFPPNGWKCRCVVTQTDEKVSHLNSAGKDTDPDNPPPFKKGSEPFSNNPAVSGKVFNESRYFRKAGEGDFKNVQNAIFTAHYQDVRLNATVKAKEGIIKTNLKSSIQVSNNSKENVVNHYNEKMPDFLKIDLLFDIENIMQHLTLEDRFKAVKNKKKKHEKRGVVAWHYYTFEYLKTEMYLGVKIYKDRNTKDNLYFILDHEPVIQEDQ